MDLTARMQALGDPPSSHAKRFRFVPHADASVFSTIQCGIFFVMAFWSCPARKAFAELKRVLADIDPAGRLDLVVADIDESPALTSIVELATSLHGAGETVWVKQGKIFRTSGFGYHPECFERFTRELLSECPT